MHIVVHTHVLPFDCFDAVDSTGRHFGPGKIQGIKGKKEANLSSPNAAQFWGMETRLKDMDASNIDFEVISISPNALTYELDREAGAWYRGRLNDGITMMVKEVPKRFVGIADVPL